MNYVSMEDSGEGFKAEVRIRYNSPQVPATVRILENGQAEIIFDKPQKSVTPGQSAVLYKNDVTLAGGIIVQPLPLEDASFEDPLMMSTQGEL